MTKHSASIAIYAALCAGILCAEHSAAVLPAYAAGRGAAVSAAVADDPRATAGMLDPHLDRGCRAGLRQGVTAVFCDRRARGGPVRLHAASHRADSRRRAARGQARLYGAPIRPGQLVTLSEGRTSRSAHVVLLFQARRGGVYVRFSRFPGLRSRKGVITSRRTSTGRLLVRMRIRGRAVRPVLQRAFRVRDERPSSPLPTAPVPPASPLADGRFEVTECGGATPRAGAAASAFDALWRRSGPGWTGGDGTYSARLPDGRILWVFGDTFLGGVLEGGVRAPNSVMVSNSFVVQDDNCVTTLAGGSREHPTAIVGTGESGSWYWPGAARVSGSTVTVALWRYSRTGSGMWDWRFDGSAMAFFSLPDLRLRDVVALPGDRRVAWGVAFLDTGDETYVYGVEDRGLDKRLHVARAPTAQLTADWQYYDGTGWSRDSAASAPLLSGVSNMFSVVAAADGVHLITQRPLSDRIVLHRAAAPSGPWDEGIDIAQIPDPGSGRMTYNALAHPELSTAGKLLLSYNVNATSPAGAYASADAYRPRFLVADYDG